MRRVQRKGRKEWGKKKKKDSDRHKEREDKDGKWVKGGQQLEKYKVKEKGPLKEAEEEQKEVHRNDAGRSGRTTHVDAAAYRQTASLQRGHAAPCGGPGVQHVLPRRFEFSALRWHVAVPHGHQNRVFVAAVQPLFGFHGGLRPCCVRVQVVLEEV